MTSQRCRTAALVAAFSLILPVLPSVAKYRPPSGLQLPGGRQGAATRSGCENDGFIFAPVLPASNYGLTTEAYPTLYWYQKNHQFSWARFELFATQSLKPEAFPLYSTTFRLNGSSPLASLTLPFQAGLPPLGVGQTYLWRVSLICSQLGPDEQLASLSQRSIQGWIKRVEPFTALKSELAQSSRKYEVYATRGVWYDAIVDLAARRHLQPQDLKLSKDWQDLIRETSLSSTHF